MASPVIYALATARAQAALAVFRVSGLGAHATLRRLIGVLPPSRQVTLKALRHPVSGLLIDRGLVTVFEHGASFTGEESAELTVHGGLAVIDAVAEALEAAGAQLAMPGEFSRRALANGRLDLAQAESIADLIQAQTDSERRAALRGLEGDVGRRAAFWRDELVSGLGLLETSIDFVEEGLGADLSTEARRRFEGLVRAWRSEADHHEAVETDDRTIALIGPPNAGKSSVLNAVAGRDVAIVTEIAGTTRDVLSTTFLVSGARVTLADTAGMRLSMDPIEKIGVDRATALASTADRRVFAFSADTWPTLSETEKAQFAAFRRPGDLVLWTKADLAPEAPKALETWAGAPVLAVSVTDTSARRAVLAAAEQLVETVDAPLEVVGSTARRRAVLRAAAETLSEAIAYLTSGHLELAIESGRQSADILERLTGAIGHEDVLDMVFSRFCVGK